MAAFVQLQVRSKSGRVWYEITQQTNFMMVSNKIRKLEDQRETPATWGSSWQDFYSWLECSPVWWIHQPQSYNIYYQLNKSPGHRLMTDTEGTDWWQLLRIWNECDQVINESPTNQQQQRIRDYLNVNIIRRITTTSQRLKVSLPNETSSTRFECLNWYKTENYQHADKLADFIN